MAEVADGDAPIDGDLALVGVILANNHAEQCGLAGSVRTDEADLLAFLDGRGRLDEEDLVAILLANAVETNHVCTGLEKLRRLYAGPVIRSEVNSRLTMRRSREFPTTPVCEQILRATADFEEKFFTCKGTQAESLSREFIRKRRMPVRPLDTLIAIKVINLMPGLRQNDRRVGATLIEHFNRRTGRCDPGLNRLAEMLGLCVRTVIRSTQRLETVGLFRKVRHGGYSNRNSYEPNWARIANSPKLWTRGFQFRGR